MLKFNSSHWLKLQNSDWKANLVKDFFSQINFPPMSGLESITGHVISKLRLPTETHQGLRSILNDFFESK